MVTVAHPFYEILLCDSITLRYTISVSRSRNTYKSANGFYNNVRFYFYSPALKKSIGYDWRTTYSPNLKAVKNDGSIPEAKLPDDDLIRRAITELLNKNVGISLAQKKETKSGTRTICLDSDELFVFWLTRYQDFAKLDNSIRTDEMRHKAFAKLCITIGRYRLSTLCTSISKELDSACDKLVSGIKEALRIDKNKSTGNTGEKTQIIRYALTLYLSEQGIDPGPILARLMKMSIPKKSVTAKIADNMRAQSLPIERYNELYSALKNDTSDIAKGLQLMLFLGLTKEEVCGLNLSDVQNIPDYYGAIHLSISRLYRKEGKEYKLCYDEDVASYRFFPLPFPIYNLFARPSHANKENENPLLTDKNGKRIKPDILEKKLKELLQEESNIIAVNIDGKTKNVDLAFLSSSYRASARYYWHYYCGLTEGEIHYLGGLSAPDTLSGHYIDFNNSSEQYRMLKQLEHGIALLTRETEQSRNGFEQLSRKTTEVTADRDTRVSMNLLVREPITLSLSSWRGLQITKEADK